MGITQRMVTTRIECDYCDKCFNAKPSEYDGVRGLAAMTGLNILTYCVPFPPGSGYPEDRVVCDGVGCQRAFAREMLEAFEGIA